MVLNGTRQQRQEERPEVNDDDTNDTDGNVDNDDVATTKPNFKKETFFTQKARNEPKDSDFVKASPNIFLLMNISEGPNLRTN